jgi:nicotinamidase-related amidase
MRQLRRNYLIADINSQSLRQKTTGSVYAFGIGRQGAQLSNTAILLVDLQRDFLGEKGSRMPVDPEGAAAVLRSANAILTEHALGSAIPVLIVNQFPASAHIANFFRHRAALAGSPGAEIDPRVRNYGQVKVISKCRPSAFTNPELDAFLNSLGIRELYVIGVFAEGCVRATVLDALRHGYKVNVIAGAVATNRPWKKHFALWAMKRAGATLLPTLDQAGVSGASN